MSHSNESSPYNDNLVEEMSTRYYGVDPDGDKNNTGKLIPPVNCDAFEPPKENKTPGGKCLFVLVGGLLFLSFLGITTTVMFV